MSRCERIYADEDSFTLLAETTDWWSHCTFGGQAAPLGFLKRLAHPPAVRRRPFGQATTMHEPWYFSMPLKVVGGTTHSCWALN